MLLYPVYSVESVPYMWCCVRHGNAIHSAFEIKRRSMSTRPCIWLSAHWCWMLRIEAVNKNAINLICSIHFRQSSVAILMKCSTYSDFSIYFSRSLHPSSHTLHCMSLIRRHFIGSGHSNFNKQLLFMTFHTPNKIVICIFFPLPSLSPNPSIVYIQFYFIWLKNFLTNLNLQMHGSLFFRCNSPNCNGYAFWLLI